MSEIKLLFKSNGKYINKGALAGKQGQTPLDYISNSSTLGINTHNR